MVPAPIPCTNRVANSPKMLSANANIVKATADTLTSKTTYYGVSIADPTVHSVEKYQILPGWVKKVHHVVAVDDTGDRHLLFMFRPDKNFEVVAGALQRVQKNPGR